MELARVCINIAYVAMSRTRLSAQYRSYSEISSGQKLKEKWTYMHIN